MKSVFLRALTTEDYVYTNKWHTDIDLYKFLVGPFWYVSTEAEKEWVKEKSSYSPLEINLMICLSRNSAPIGLICLREIDWIARTGHISTIFIGDPSFRGKGYGTEALKILLEHCFKDLGINKIWTRILDDNKASISMFKSCGFQVEGHLRQQTIKNGNYKDLIMVGLCADQYFDQEE